jgi:hypothetical protein
MCRNVNPVASVKKDIGPGEVARSAEQGSKSDDLSLRVGYA